MFIVYMISVTFFSRLSLTAPLKFLRSTLSCCPLLVRYLSVTCSIIQRTNNGPISDKYRTYIEQKQGLLPVPMTMNIQSFWAKKEQHPLRMLLPAVLFKIALNYETSMALVTFSFGSVFGMVIVRMPSSTLAEI